MLTLKNLFKNWLIKTILCLYLLTLCKSGYAQATKGSAFAIVCPVDGSSIQILAANVSRFSYAIFNYSNFDIRVGYVASGTPDLTDSNSYVLRSSVAIADSTPGVFFGRIVCMSTSATSTATIHISETKRP